MRGEGRHRFNGSRLRSRNSSRSPTRTPPAEGCPPLLASDLRQFAIAVSCVGAVTLAVAGSRFRRATLRTGSQRVGASTLPPRYGGHVARRCGQPRRAAPRRTNRTNNLLAGTFFSPPPFTVRTAPGGAVTFSVGPHQTQLYGVSFNPTPSSPGHCDTTRYEGEIRTDSPLCATVHISGTGAWACDCSVSPTTLTFGNVVVGETSPSQTVTVRNGSPKAGSRGTIRVVSGDFVAPAVGIRLLASPNVVPGFRGQESHRPLQSRAPASSSHEILTNQG